MAVNHRHFAIVIGCGQTVVFALASHSLHNIFGRVLGALATKAKSANNWQVPKPTRYLADILLVLLAALALQLSQAREVVLCAGGCSAALILRSLTSTKEFIDDAFWLAGAVTLGPA